MKPSSEPLTSSSDRRLTLRQEIERLGGTSKFANQSEADMILAQSGDVEVTPTLVTHEGRLFCVCGGQVVLAFVGQQKISTRRFYIVVDDRPSNGWKVTDPNRGRKPSDVLRLVVSI